MKMKMMMMMMMMMIMIDKDRMSLWWFYMFLCKSMFLIQWGDALQKEPKPSNVRASGRSRSSVSFRWGNEVSRRHRQPVSVRISLACCRSFRASATGASSASWVGQISPCRRNSVLVCGPSISASGASKKV